MGLNIKNEETCRLARELAQVTGESMTGAITVALRERLERERRQRGVNARLRKMRAIAERCAKLVRDGGPSAVEHGELLYDERGLPK
ncbi:MAG: type II toxin-antitoxin system VapB family antitoxin [Chloroflexi bacterium]|nr:type II toxin-antitoxin system VapB family antitoxin [Chloroflexota bacterium]MCY3939269.1 type II toxin-antitoxin system VapB family antitoxin [Chloroflexota bacterium]